MQIVLICCSRTRYGESIKEIYTVPKNPTVLAVGVSDSNNELRDLYLEHLKYKNNSPNTIDNYRVVINQMYDLGIKDLENV